MGLYIGNIRYCPVIKKVGALPYDAEVEYIETDGSMLIDTGIYPTSLNITVEYATMNSMSFGWTYNNQANNTWIGPSGSMVFWKNWNTSYRYSIPGYNDGTWNMWRYDMQSGFYKNGALLKSFTASLGKTQISSIPLYIGNCYDGNKSSYSTSSFGYSIRIKSCKIYSGSTLARVYIPVRVGSVGYLYDKISGALFSGVGTGSFTLGPDIINQYDSKIEYIEGTGTQWINTGIRSYIGDSVSITLSTTSFGNSFLCGARTNSSGMTGSFFIYGNVSDSVYFAANSTAVTSDVNIQDGEIHIIEHKQDGGYIDGVKKVSMSISENPSTRPYTIFTLNDRDTPTNISSCKLYGFTYKRGETVIMDLIPVRKNGVGYMYDKVSHVLLGNVGSGSFTLGPDIT